MPNAEALKALQAGRTEWELFRAKAFKGTNGKRLTEGRIDLRSADLRYMDLSGYDLSRVDFSALPEKASKANGNAANDHIKGNGKDGADPESSVDKDNADILARADLSFANLSNAYLFGSRFCGTRLAGTDLTGANIGGAEFIEAVLDHKSSLRRAKGDAETLFKKCRIDGTDLSGADLSGTSFENSRLHDADLSGVRFFRARLNGTSWKGTRIDERTDFEQANFPEHESGLDQSEHMIVPSGINWTHARWIGDKTLAIFAALGLAVCFVIISAVRAAHNGLAPGSAFALLSPAAIHTLMIGFAFILAGAILFRRRCPEEVKNFTAAQWVYLAGHPRPVYLARALKARTEAAASLALVTVGFLVLGFALKAIILAATCPACFGGP